MPTTIDSAGITFNDATSLTSANIGTAQLVNGSVTADKLGTNEQKRIAKAWVNFDGTTSSENLAGTYSQSGTTVTVTTVSNHNLSQGQGIYANITTGTGVDGVYTVATITSPTVFTYTAGTSLTTSGNVTLNRSSIRSSYNVSSITKNGTGDYTVNFQTPMSDENYGVVFGSVSTYSNQAYAIVNLAGASTGISSGPPLLKTPSQVRIISGLSGTGALYNITDIYVQIFGN